jgi:hypothetical protein
VPITSFAQTPTWTFAQLCNGTGGCWFTFPTGDYCGLFHMYAIQGNDPNGAIFNPGGSVSVPLPDGSHTFTVLGTGGSGSFVTQRNLFLTFNNGAGPHIDLSSTGPSSVSYASGLTTITASNLNYVEGAISGLDRIGVCGSFPDGHTDTIATFTLDVVTQTPQSHLADLQATLSTIAGLSAGDINALSAKLNSAVASLDRGNENAAEGQLGAFVHQVNALIRSRRLTAAQGQILINAVEAVLTHIE